MEEARALIELQNVDMQVIRARNALEQIPETAQIQQVRAKLKELARRMTKIVGALKDAQIEVEDNAGRRQTLTGYVDAINEENASSTDFRRIQDNNAELERLAKRLEKVDFNQNKAKAEADRLSGVLDQATAMKAQLEARERELLEAFRTRAQDIKDELTRLIGERESLVSSLSAELLARYQASCKAHGQVGVAELDGGACTGCRVQLQPSQVDVLRQGPDVSVCPVCGRLLVVRS